PQGQGWSILINGSATFSVSIAPGTTQEVRIDVSGFPSNAENASMSVTVQSGDGRIDRSVTVAVSFARGVAAIDANSLVVSGTHTDAEGSFTVQVTVRNIGPGTLTGVTVELRKDGSLMVDSAPLGAVPPGGSAQVTLTWVTSQGDSNAPHTLAVALAGRNDEVLVPGSFTVERTEQTFIQRLTSDSLLPMLLIGGLLVGFVGGLLARGGKRRQRRSSKSESGPVDEQAAALAGLDELEAEGEGAIPAELAASSPAVAAPGMEHKVICPNCAMEQWIVGKEGECPNCGVLIEVDEAPPEGGEPKGESG
ncbi:MAG: CARDB domain-containing protein, partial [Candidatus Rokuibacteriota bacterium]